MDLREALLQSGKIDAKQKRKAEREQKFKEHKKRKRKKKKKNKGTEVQPVVQNLEALKAEREAKKRREIGRWIQEGYIDQTGRRRFYFITREEEIYFIPVSDVMGYKLERGQAAIVEDPRGSKYDHALVTREVALKIMEIDRSYVRFFQG